MRKGIDCHGKEWEEYCVKMKPDKDLTGYVLGKSDIVYGGKVYWDVLCECGTVKCIRGDALRDGIAVSCGCQNASSGEVIISKLLKKYQIAFKGQYTFSDLLSKNGYRLRYDFCVLDNISPIRLIEFDGIQHFKPVDFFGGEKAFQILQENDILKNQYALSHNIPLVRIPYTKKSSININDLLGDKYLIS